MFKSTCVIAMSKPYLPNVKSHHLEFKKINLVMRLPTYDMVLTSLISTSLAYIYIGFVGK